MRLRIAALMLFTVLGLSAGAQQTKQTLVIRFDEKSVVVSGVTPGGDVLLVFVARSKEGYSEVVYRANERRSDSDGDGAVTLDLPWTIPQSAVIVAVDERTGDFAIGSPNGRVPLLPDIAEDLRRDGVHDVAELRSRAEFAQVALVRPGRGSWSASLSSSGRGPTGEADGHMHVQFDRLTANGKSGAAPARLQNNDVLVLINEQTLEILVHREVAQP